MRKKFILLPIGENFEYQGKRYTKTGPLTAAQEENGRQRMIPRSTMVTTVGENAQQAPQVAPGGVLDAAAVTAAFELYHNGCQEWLALAEKELSGETALQMREAMAQARQRLLDELKRLERTPG